MELDARTVLKEEIIQGPLYPVLVVQVPNKGDRDLVEVRDFILDSLEKGLLVVSNGTTYHWEEFPMLTGIHVVPAGLEPEGETVIRAHDFEELASPLLQTKKVEVVSEDQAKKKKILERLRQYRNANGLGCLEAVAKACRSNAITAMVLRDVVLGAAVLGMKDWMKIDRALDKLEKKESSASEEEGKDG